MDNRLGGIETSSRIRAGEMLANCSCSLPAGSASAKELKNLRKNRVRLSDPESRQLDS